jgi:hypothetical protein
MARSTVLFSAIFSIFKVFRYNYCGPSEIGIKDFCIGIGTVLQIKTLLIRIRILLFTLIRIFIPKKTYLGTKKYSLPVGTNRFFYTKHEIAL